MQPLLRPINSDQRLLAGSVVRLYSILMPTVLRQDGFDVMIYMHDHAPIHVHVFRAGERIILNVGDDETGVSLRENISMSRQNARKAFELVEDNRAALIERWNGIHGKAHQR